MHEAVRSQCWAPLREMAVLTKCHSLPTLSLAPHLQSLSWSRVVYDCVLVMTVNSWMLVRLEWYSTAAAVKHRKDFAWRSHSCVPCSEPPMVWRWQTGHKQSSSWPWKHNTTHDWDLYVSKSLLVPSLCVCVCVCLHDNLLARGLQHHVLGPVVPVLIGLGLVHNLLEHRSLPARKNKRLY